MYRGEQQRYKVKLKSFIVIVLDSLAERNSVEGQNAQNRLPFTGANLVAPPPKDQTLRLPVPPACWLALGL